MNTVAPSGRLYGDRYDRTRRFKSVANLAERMIADLSTNPRFQGIPTEATFSIRVVSGIFLYVEVGGLSDEFIFADYTDTKYSTPAIALRERIMAFIETYNWTNSDDRYD